MSIKKYLSVVCLLTCNVTMLMAKVPYLTIQKTTGNKYSFLLTDMPVLKFNGEEMCVITNDTTYFSVDDVAFYYFTEVDKSLVTNQVANSLRVITDGSSSVTIEKAVPLANVAVFNMSGNLLNTIRCDSEGNANISLPQAKGVYVIVVGNFSFKVIRK